jgi:hypothetical protein
VFVRFKGVAAQEFLDLLREEEDELRSEIGDELRFFEGDDSELPTLSVRTSHDLADTSSYSEQITWLNEMCNRFIAALRPRLSRLASR